MKYFLSLFFLISLLECGNSNQLPHFTTSNHFEEQVLSFDYEPQVKISINAPSIKNLDPKKETKLIFYALPNGSTIEQTIGKRRAPGDDKQFDRQHIGAQTRFLRKQLPNYNIVTVYLQAEQRSWPLWKKEHKNYEEIIKKIVGKVRSLFAEFKTRMVLTGHSGGGRFIFGFMDAYPKIPDYVERISFLDSDYGYTDSYGKKIVDWLGTSDKKYLSVLAYNDSIALYQGKPFVSDTGGTWVRSKMIKRYLSKKYKLVTVEDSAFYKSWGLNGRIRIFLKKNPKREVLHTVQVERNGFIEGMLSGTKYENKGYIYYGPRAYSAFIQKDMP